MAIPTSLDISFVDATGNSVGVDDVTLTIAGVAVNQNAVPFRFMLNTVGKGTITFTKDKTSFPYSFNVEVVDTVRDFTLKFDSGALDIPRMASLLKVAPSSAGMGSGSMHLKFTLADPKELVLVTGFDYHGGAKNRIFAITRMHDLRSSIDDSTVITYFEMETGIRTQWVKGRDREKIRDHMWTSGWCKMTEELQGTAAPVLVKDGGDPGGNAISITHVYDYLKSIGVDRPKSLAEFSIFGHSGQSGPILFNTWEANDYNISFTGATKTLERDPEDHDARFWKDFNSTNMPDVANLKAAFSANSHVQIWGCFATADFRRLINKARRAPDNVSPLGLAVEIRTGFENTVFPDNRAGIIRMLKESIFKANYMFVLSQAIGRPVFGGPPGLGSEHLENGKFSRSYIPRRSLTMVRGRRVKGKPYYKHELDFLKSAIPTWKFNSDFYLKYE